MRSASISIALLISLTTGCAVRQLRNDQDRIRTALLDLYTNQIIDNLIRASNGMPFIQLDYSNAQGTVTVQGNAGFGDGQQATIGQQITNALQITRQFVTNPTVSLSAQSTNQVAIVANPVITSNEVYDAYLEFLGLPGSLLVSPDPPPPCASHITKRVGDKYYWVPIEYKLEFLRLSLITTAQRGQTLLAPDDFYSVNLVDVVPPIDDGQVPNSKNLTIKIDKAIPNDSGRVEFSIKGDDGAAKNFELTIRRYVDPETDGEPTPTNLITVVFFADQIPGAKTPAELKKMFPLAVKIYLDHKPPRTPNTEDLLQRANFQLQQIQMNQLRIR